MQVDYSTTDDELKELFSGCGTLKRVTIRKDKVREHNRTAMLSVVM